MTAMTAPRIRPPDAPASTRPATRVSDRAQPEHLLRRGWCRTGPCSARTDRGRASPHGPSRAVQPGQLSRPWANSPSTSSGSVPTVSTGAAEHQATVLPSRARHARAAAVTPWSCSCLPTSTQDDLALVRGIVELSAAALLRRGQPGRRPAPADCRAQMLIGGHGGARPDATRRCIRGVSDSCNVGATVLCLASPPRTRSHSPSRR